MVKAVVGVSGLAEHDHQGGHENYDCDDEAQDADAGHPGAFRLVVHPSEPQYESHQRYEESEERPSYASAVVHRRSGEVLLLNPAVRVYDRLLVYDCAAFPTIGYGNSFPMLLIKRCFLIPGSMGAYPRVYLLLDFFVFFCAGEGDQGFVEFTALPPGWYCNPTNPFRALHSALGCLERRSGHMAVIHAKLFILEVGDEPFSA